MSHDGFSLFDSENEDAKDDVKIPNAEVGEKILKLIEAKKEVWLIVQAAMGEEAVIEAKERKGCLNESGIKERE